MDTISSSRKQIVLKRGRSEIGVDNVTRLGVSSGDPLCELHGVGNGGGEENVVHFVGKQDDGLFPNYSSLWRWNMRECQQRRGE